MTGSLVTKLKRIRRQVRSTHTKSQRSSHVRVDRRALISWREAIVLKNIVLPVKVVCMNRDGPRRGQPYRSEVIDGNDIRPWMISDPSQHFDEARLTIVGRVHIPDLVPGRGGLEALTCHVKMVVLVDQPLGIRPVAGHATFLLVLTLVGAGLAEDVGKVIVQRVTRRPIALEAGCIVALQLGDVPGCAGWLSFRTRCVLVDVDGVVRESYLLLDGFLAGDAAVDAYSPDYPFAATPRSGHPLVDRSYPAQASPRAMLASPKARKGEQSAVNVVSICKRPYHS